MKTIKIGVIGAEGRGQIARLAHQPDKGIFLAAACSLNVEALSGMKEEFGGSFQISSDYRDLVNNPDLDALFITTPDFLHEEHAVAAFAAGKHVYLEKPMAISTESCDRILQAARDSGKILYPGHNMRFFPVMKKLKELVAEGAVGRVEAIWCRHFISYGGDAYFKDWHSERHLQNSLLLQKAVHDIDMIHWFADAFSRRVVAMGKLSVYDRLPRRAENEPCPKVRFDRANYPPEITSGYSPRIDVEDHSMILMELENGIQASYAQCHYTPDDCRNYTIIGTRGRIENYGDLSTEESWATVHLWNRRMGYQEMGNEVYRIPHIQNGGHGGADTLIVNDFLGVLRGLPSHGASPLESRMAVAAACMATESLRDGSPPRATAFGHRATTPPTAARFEPEK